MSSAHHQHQQQQNHKMHPQVAYLVSEINRPQQTATRPTLHSPHTININILANNVEINPDGVKEAEQALFTESQELRIRGEEPVGGGTYGELVLSVFGLFGFLIVAGFAAVIGGMIIMRWLFGR